MKNILIAAVMLSASSSFAGKLICYKTNFREARTPFMTADIVADNKLKNIDFNYSNTLEQDIKRTVTGKEITTNRSPYKGNNRFDIGRSELTLPADLSNANLIRIEANGQNRNGISKGENGVIIGNYENSDSGNHYSIRLSCRSSR